jgi:stage V sporulation protein G
MEISEVRVKLVNNSGDRLKAFCSITLDGDFVIRDLKVIDGSAGPFVAMPSRKLSDRCPQCDYKNHLRARYCNYCGAKLGEHRVPTDREGRGKLHADIAHPINSACRQRIQTRVIQAYEEEVARSKQPGYVPPDYDDALSDYDQLDTDYAPPTGSDSPTSARSGAEDRESSGAEAAPRVPHRSVPDRAESSEPVEPSAPERSDDEDRGSFGEGIL